MTIGIFSQNVKKLPKKIAIIGGGASGLACASIMKNADFDVVIFEERNNIGGVWDYRPDGVLYNSLVTNLPKTAMQFSKDDVFSGKSDSKSSFATHFEVQEYLEDYYNRNELYNNIKLNTKVSKVYKQKQTQIQIQNQDNNNNNNNNSNNNNNDDEKWIIETESNNNNNNNDNDNNDNVFDAVIVCNGHYNKAAYPNIPGVNQFKGLLMHSSKYDSHLVEEFRNKNILIVGARASATDIARELKQTCNSVCVADRGLHPTQKGSTSDDGILKHRPALSKILNENDIELINGEIITNVDVIIWATGYDYDFPFLNGNYVTSNDRMVSPLYQHLFYLHDPTLCFIGLPHSVVPFPLAFIQAKWITSIFNGKKLLPNEINRKKWLENFENDLKSKDGFWPRQYHYMGASQFNYCRMIAKESGEDTLDFISYIDETEKLYNLNKLNMPLYPGDEDHYRRKYLQRGMNDK